MKKRYITITESAQSYFKGLLLEQNTEGLGIRIYVENPGTPEAECCMAYCPEGQQEPGDKTLRFDGFSVFIDKASKPFLLDATIDYCGEENNQQLSFSAPKLKENHAMEDFAEQYRRGLVKR